MQIYWQIKPRWNWGFIFFLFCANELLIPKSVSHLILWLCKCIFLKMYPRVINVRGQDIRWLKGQNNFHNWTLSDNTPPKQQPLGLLQAVVSSLTFILWNKGEKETYGRAQTISAWTLLNKVHKKSLGMAAFHMHFPSLRSCQRSFSYVSENHVAFTTLQESLLVYPVHCIQWVGNAFWEAK